VTGHKLGKGVGRQRIDRFLKSRRSCRSHATARAPPANSGQRGCFRAVIEVWGYLVCVAIRQAINVGGSMQPWRNGWPHGAEQVSRGLPSALTALSRRLGVALGSLYSEARLAGRRRLKLGNKAAFANQSRARGKQEQRYRLHGRACLSFNVPSMHHAPRCLSSGDRHAGELCALSRPRARGGAANNMLSRSISVERPISVSECRTLAGASAPVCQLLSRGA